MNIDEIFAKYTSKIAQLHLYQRAMKSLAQKELLQLDKYARLLEEKPDLKERSSSHDKMSFRDAKSGDHHFFGHTVSSVEDRQRSVLLHKNKQYQWLLAEAYEEFEDFLERAYAYIGSVDDDFWPLKDYGSISLAEVEDKKFDWYLERVQNKSDRQKRIRPQSILNQLRKKCPEIATVERQNAFNIDLKLALVLVELIRHAVVHTGGTVADKNAFVEGVLEKAGLHNNGKPKAEYVDFVQGFFGAGNYENTILLLEVRVNPEIPLNIYVDLFDQLTRYMVSYAHLVVKALNQYREKSLHNRRFKQA